MPGRHLTTVLTLTAFCCLSIAQTKTAPAPKPKGQLRIVAGIVSPDGTVRFLPRVEIKVMPSEFGKADAAATESLNSQAQAERKQHDETVRGLVNARRNEMGEAAERYRQRLEAALSNFNPSALSLLPACITYDNIRENAERGACNDSIAYLRQKVNFSSPLREFLASEHVLGKFDARTFVYSATPISKGRQAFEGVSTTALMRIPEFTQEVQKALSKESKGLKANQPIPPNVDAAAVSRFLDEWGKAASKRNFLEPRVGLRKFGNVNFGDLAFAVQKMEGAIATAKQSVTDAELAKYIADKDAISARYDRLQATAESRLQQALERLEREREDALASASVKFKPVVTGQTSLQGEFVTSLASGPYLVYAEDVTTDRRYHWAIPIRTTASETFKLELTDANAVKTPASTFATASSKSVYPTAASLSPDERAEYRLRYGHRLMKSWERAARLNDVVPNSELFSAEDTPLGFGFAVSGRSTVVFNSLRISDNDAAARFFKESVSNFLKSLPDDLKATGGTRAFEAVTVSVTGSIKSFADQYTTGDSFTYSYCFKLTDVESFAADKINAQQLLDRAHIKDSRTGRISVQLASSH